MSEKDNIRNEIANRLRTARENAGLSQAQASKLLGLHRPTLTEIELGNRRVTGEELKLCARIYDVSVSWLLDEFVHLHGDLSTEVLLAAREMGRLKDADLRRVMEIIRSVPREEQ